MNKSWDSASFVNGIKDAKIWSNGTAAFLKSALVAVALNSTPALAQSPQIDLAGNETMITAPQTLNFNKLDYSQYTQGEKLRTLEGAGYADIALHRRSGVYEHPNLPGQMVTLKFAEDPDADKRIQADLAVLYGDDLGYRWQNGLSRMMFGFGAREAREGGNSFHIQDPFNIGQDVNFIYMRDKNIAKDTIIKGLNSLTPEQISTYSAIRIIEHEIAHSLPHQQMSLGQLAGAAFNADHLRSLEVSAEFIAQIAVLQQMKKDGIDNDTIKQYLDLTNDYNWRDIGSERSTKMDYVKSDPNDIGIADSDLESKVTHPVFISTAILSNMFGDDPNAILSLTREDVEKLSAKLMEQIKHHDFSKDVVQQVEFNLNNNAENQEKIALITNILLNADRDHRNGDKRSFDEIINQLKQGNSFFEQALVHRLEQHRDDFGRLGQADLNDIVKNAYRDAKLSPLDGTRVNALSTEGQLLLGKVGRLDLLALDTAYRDALVRDVLSKYPQYTPSATLHTPKPAFEAQEISQRSDLVVPQAQQALLNELYGLRENTRPAQLAVDLQRALKENNPALPDDSWKVIADGLRNNKDLKAILDDVNKHIERNNLPVLTHEPTPATSAPEYDRYAEHNRPRPGFAPKPGAR